MTRLQVFLLSVALSVLISSLFGIIHDQISFNVSPEYYTCFKFEMFHVKPLAEQSPRLAAALVGFMASWWVGLIAGIILALVARRFPHSSVRIRKTLAAMGMAVAIAFVCSIGGLLYGLYGAPEATAHTGVYEYWYIPNGLIHQHNFIAVGWMHNLSYAGSLTGLIAAVIFLFKTKKTRHRTV